MNKLTVFFVIGMIFIAGVFYMNMQSKLAQERCAMAGGIWSDADGACDT